MGKTAGEGDYMSSFMADGVPESLLARIKRDYLGLAHEMLLGGNKKRAVKVIMDMDSVLDLPQGSRQAKLKSVLLRLRKSDSAEKKKTQTVG